MSYQIGDRVLTSKIIKAGLQEDGPIVCDQNLTGTVMEIQKNEWDGVYVKMDSGLLWWFKPGQLALTDT